MSRFFSKFRDVVASIVADGKDVSFAALVHPADDIDRWDLVILSSDLAKEGLCAVEYVFGHIWKTLTKKELLMLSRIVIRRPDDPMINELIDSGQLRTGHMVWLPHEEFDRVYQVLPRQTVAKAG